MKRPTQKQKETMKIAKAASKPLPKPERHVREEAVVEAGKKKRKTLRAKIDKVGAA